MVPDKLREDHTEYSHSPDERANALLPGFPGGLRQGRGVS